MKNVIYSCKHLKNLTLKKPKRPPPPPEETKINYQDILQWQKLFKDKQPPTKQYMYLHPVYLILLRHFQKIIGSITYAIAKTKTVFAKLDFLRSVLDLVLSQASTPSQCGPAWCHSLPLPVYSSGLSQRFYDSSQKILLCLGSFVCETGTVT